MSDVADDITEEYATAMEEAIYSATKAEAETETEKSSFIITLRRSSEITMSLGFCR